MKINKRKVYPGCFHFGRRLKEHRLYSSIEHRCSIEYIARLDLIVNNYGKIERQCNYSYVDPKWLQYFSAWGPGHGRPHQRDFLAFRVLRLNRAMSAHQLNIGRYQSWYQEMSNQEVWRKTQHDCRVGVGAWSSSVVKEQPWLRANFFGSKAIILKLGNMGMFNMGTRE